MNLLRPSSANRFFNCPFFAHYAAFGKVEESPTKFGSAAHIGKVKHDAVEHIVKWLQGFAAKNDDVSMETILKVMKVMLASAIKGFIQNGGSRFTWDKTEEATLGWAIKRLANKIQKGACVTTERRVHIHGFRIFNCTNGTCEEAKIAGTADVIIEGPDLLELWDWKMGVIIVPIDTLQVALYARGALDYLRHKATSVSVSIVQPHDPDSPVKTKIYSRDGLKKLDSCAIIADNKPQTARMGSWCTFCPLMNNNCTAFQEREFSMLESVPMF